MAEVTIRRCDRCGTECGKGGDYGQRVTLHGHHNREIDLCRVCSDALHVWLSLDGMQPCFDEAYEHEIASRLSPPEGFPHLFENGSLIVDGRGRRG